MTVEPDYETLARNAGWRPSVLRCYVGMWVNIRDCEEAVREARQTRSYRDAKLAEYYAWKRTVRRLPSAEAVCRELGLISTDTEEKPR